MQNEKKPPLLLYSNVQYHLYVAEKINRGGARAEKEGAISQDDVERKPVKISRGHTHRGLTACSRGGLRADQHVSERLQAVIVEGHKASNSHIHNKILYRQRTTENLLLDN